jgi:hypothetical protein
MAFVYIICAYTSNSDIENMELLWDDQIQVAETMAKPRTMTEPSKSSLPVPVTWMVNKI